MAALSRSFAAGVGGTLRIASPSRTSVTARKASARRCDSLLSRNGRYRSRGRSSAPANSITRARITASSSAASSGVPKSQPDSRSQYMSKTFRHTARL